MIKISKIHPYISYMLNFNEEHKIKSSLNMYLYLLKYNFLNIRYTDFKNHKMNSYLSLTKLNSTNPVISSKIHYNYHTKSLLVLFYNLVDLVLIDIVHLKDNKDLHIWYTTIMNQYLYSYLSNYIVLDHSRSKSSVDHIKDTIHYLYI